MNRRTLIAASLCLACCGLHAENIQFADRSVKALCLQHWDSDGDGQLSTEEAAAVTTLGEVFKSSSYGTVFPELRYFTGLTKIDDYAFYKSSIQHVEFPSTVTAIGEYAFSESNISGELRIPGTVKSISDHAFQQCRQMTSVILEEGVQTIGWKSFTGPIGILSLPSTLTYMSSMAIDPYVSAGSSSGVMIPEGDLYVYVHSTTPPAVHDYAFYYMFTDCHLVVPTGFIEAYKAAYAWSKFGEYLEYGDVNLDGLVNDSDLSAIENFMSSGESEFNPLLSDVNFDGVTDEKDVEYLKNYIESTTSVSSINLTPADTHVYTIDGRRLPDNITISSLPHGVYISNGRKFIVK